MGCGAGSGAFLEVPARGGAGGGCTLALRAWSTPAEESFGGSTKRGHGGLGSSRVLHAGSWAAEDPSSFLYRSSSPFVSLLLALSLSAFLTRGRGSAWPSRRRSSSSRLASRRRGVRRHVGLEPLVLELLLGFQLLPPPLLLVLAPLLRALELFVHVGPARRRARAALLGGSVGAAGLRALVLRGRVVRRFAGCGRPGGRRGRGRELAGASCRRCRWLGCSSRLVPPRLFVLLDPRLEGGCLLLDQAGGRQACDRTSKSEGLTRVRWRTAGEYGGWRAR